jgi:hypothetical protein
VAAAAAAGGMTLVGCGMEFRFHLWLRLANREKSSHCRIWDMAFQFSICFIGTVAIALRVPVLDFTAFLFAHPGI